MRLFLSDTCYEPLFALPKKIQTKVVNFQKKFRECTTANGMHLEPIAQFNDDSMRTARIDDNYRAVIGLIDDNAYLLYVGTHENAYNWGIRKKLVWNDHTQACQLVTIHQTTETVVKTEEKTAEDSYPFSGITTEKWLKIGVPLDLIKQVALIKSLDDLDPLEEYLPTDAFENIYNLLDGIDIDEIIEEIEEGYWEVTGPEIERLVAMTDFANDEAIARFRQKIKRIGFIDELRTLEATDNDTISIGDMEFEYHEFFD